MKTNYLSTSILGALACGCAMLSAQVSSASEYQVTVPTAGLIGNPAGPFSLDFQLNDGSGTGAGLNTAAILNFAFGGGAPVGVPSIFGGATGNLTTGIAMQTTSPFNEIFQGFVPGAVLSFDVVLSQNPQAGGTPDEFSFAILDQNLLNLPTTALGDSLFNVALGATPAVQTGSGTTVPGLTVTAVAPDAASPATLAFAALGLVGMGRFARRKTQVA